MANKLDVRVTIDVQGRAVAAAAVQDKAVGQALAQMGNEVGTKLATAKCPEHGQGPTDVRIHVARGGKADLRYESCCAKLRDVVGGLLG
ncbi:MAG: hypothetical protein IPG50_09935 [Myxococcales bacterium]|nr:hypothetical protein [Myxococcales bacterium]